MRGFETLIVGILLLGSALFRRDILNEDISNETLLAFSLVVLLGSVMFVATAINRALVYVAKGGKGKHESPWKANKLSNNRRVYSCVKCGKEVDHCSCDVCHDLHCNWPKCSVVNCNERRIKGGSVNG